MENEKYIGLETLAIRLGLSQAYLKRQAESGKIPCLKVGSRLRFQLNTVRTALDKIEKQSIRESQKRTILGGAKC